MILLCTKHSLQVREEEEGQWWCPEGHQVHSAMTSDQLDSFSYALEMITEYAA